MEIRLAYEQGLLSGRHITSFQRWGLSYWIYMQRRIHMEDVRAIQELQTFELHFDRWKHLHMGDLEDVDGEGYTGVNDPREIDEWLRTNANALSQPREMSMAEYTPMEV